MLLWDFGDSKGNISGKSTALKVYNSIFNDKAKFIKDFLSFFKPIKKNFFDLTDLATFPE